MDGKIFKISGYLVDPNGENEAAWIREELRHLNDTSKRLIYWTGQMKIR